MTPERAREIAESRYWMRPDLGAASTIYAIHQAILQACAEQREACEAMIEAGDKQYEGTLIVEEGFLAMLDQFEKEQSSET